MSRVVVDRRRVPRSSARRAPAGRPHARELRARSARRWPRSPPAPERGGRVAGSARRSKRSSANSAARGLSPRSVARSVAAVRGFYRFLVLDRRLDEQPRRRSAAAARLAGAAEVSLARGSRRADRAARRDDAARPARSRDDRAALRDRAARHPSWSACAPPICTSTSSYLTCIGKGNKERLVPIGEQAADWVARYSRDGAARRC